MPDNSNTQITARQLRKMYEIDIHRKCLASSFVRLFMCLFSDITGGTAVNCGTGCRKVCIRLT